MAEPDASASVKGITKLSVDPIDPINPIAWGTNDSNVELTTNKVTGFSSPTDVQYPSALLVATQLLLKADKVVVTPGTGTKVSWNSDGLITGGSASSTADIGESIDKRYVSETQHEALLNLSGVNTGDQDLTAYALQSGLDTTNSNVSALSGSLASYALASDLSTTNSNVAAINAELANYALTSSLATTQAEVDAIETDLIATYTPLSTFSALSTDFSTFVTNMTNTEFVESSTAAEVKLTFEGGLTRTGNVVTSDILLGPAPPHTFLGNITDFDEPAVFVQPAVADLEDGSTGIGKIVLDTGPTIDVVTLTGQTVARLTDANVSTAPTVLVIEHDFSGGGSIVPGFGATLEFRARSTTTSDRTQGAIRTVWVDPTDGTRDSNMVFSPVRDTAAVDSLWLRSDGSMSLGTNTGSGLGVFYASGGFQTAGTGTPGQTLIDNGNRFIPGKLDAAFLTGQFLSCPSVKSTTVDQTAATEQIHFTTPITGGSTAGTAWRVTIWGNMEQGTTSINIFSSLRWGGLTGVLLLNSPTVVTPSSAETNRAWRVEYLLIITSAGTNGSARASSIIQETMTDNTGKVTVGMNNTGVSDITGVNTTISTSLDISWTISSTSGAPHVRTFGGFIESVVKPTAAPS